MVCQGQLGLKPTGHLNHGILSGLCTYSFSHSSLIYSASTLSCISHLQSSSSCRLSSFMAHCDSNTRHSSTHLSVLRLNSCTSEVKLLFSLGWNDDHSSIDLLTGHASNMRSRDHRFSSFCSLEFKCSYF